MTYNKWNNVETFLADTLAAFSMKDLNYRPYIVCNDGFTMSVQASYYHYCSPRQSNLQTYDAAEVGFPSEYESLLQPYIETGFTEHTKSVFPWTPVKVVQKIVDKHGGINFVATLHSFIKLMSQDNAAPVSRYSAYIKKFYGE